MNKIKILSKEQYAFLKNIENPEIYKDAKEISKWLLWQEKLQIKNLKIKFND